MPIVFPYPLTNATTADADEVMANFNEIKNNFDFDTLDDASANAAAMQATTDPYPASAVSLPTDGLGEIKRIRYQIYQLLLWLDSSLSYWYEDVPTLAKIKDSTLSIVDNADTTKALQFQCSGITTGNTRTITFPDADTVFDFGTYTPSFTGVTNVDSVSGGSSIGHYMRVGSVVTVSISGVLLNPTSANTYTKYRVDLPIASDFSVAGDCGGSGASESVSDMRAVKVEGDATNDEAAIECFPADATTNTQTLHFTYKII